MATKKKMKKPTATTFTVTVTDAMLAQSIREYLEWLRSSRGSSQVKFHERA